MKFTAVVTVHSPETGLSTLFHPGDDVPQWAQTLVGAHVVDSVEPAPAGANPTSARGTKKPSASRAPKPAPKPATDAVEAW